MMESEAEWRRNMADSYHLVLLLPHIPRSQQIYAAAFEKTTFTVNTNDFFYRPDLEVIKMIDQLISNLEEDGYSVDRKVFVEGFSVGGMFSQRFTLLQPERVKAIAAGQCGGSITLPFDEYEGRKLNWPVGINDYAQLTDYEFDFQIYREIPQIIYIGDIDDTNSMIPAAGGFFGGSGNVSFLQSTFGLTDPTRIPNQVNYLQNQGLENIYLKIYPEIGHSYTSQMMKDVYEFLVSASEGNFSTPTPFPEPALPIEIDGKANDWDYSNIVAKDPAGDSSYEEWSDLESIYQTEDENYVYFMVKTKGNINSVSDKQKVLEFNLDLREESSCGHSYDLHTNISSENSISAWLDNPCSELESYDLFGYKVAWGDVLEFRIIKSELGEIEFIKPTFLHLWTDVDGEWKHVDSMEIYKFSLFD